MIIEINNCMYLKIPNYLRIMMDKSHNLNGEEPMDKTVIEPEEKENPVMIGQIDLSELLAEMRV